MSLVIPAVLPTSKTDLLEKLERFSTFPHIERVQIDVVDGKFASPASWPYNTKSDVGAIGRHMELLPHLGRIAYEVDLMCFDSLAAVRAWIAIGATRFTFHAETTTDVKKLLETVRQECGGAELSSGLVSFGVALNLSSDLARIEPVLDTVAYVQFMGIAHIGRQGEPFDDRVYEQVRVFRSRYPAIPFQVDGGITLERAKKLVVLGATNLVVGSGLLKVSDPLSTLEAFEALRSPYGV